MSRNFQQANRPASMARLTIQSRLRLHHLLHCALAGLFLLLTPPLLQPVTATSAAANAGNDPSAEPVDGVRPSARPGSGNQPSRVIEVIVIGDSTAANYTNYPHTYPLSGWAMFLQDHLSPAAVAVRDLAVPGRSSMSYYREQLWQQVKTAYLSPGDYVFIQFGHNDQRPDPLRHTDPFTTYKYYLSIYVNDSRAALANPVLVTPISRGLWHSNGVFMKDTFGNYTAAMRQLAEELHVPLIDSNEDTADLFTRLGKETTQNTLFMCLPPGKYPNYPNGAHDTTHLQVEGAKRVAALAAEAIAKTDLPLKVYLLNLARAYAAPTVRKHNEESDHESVVEPSSTTLPHA